MRPRYVGISAAFVTAAMTAVLMAILSDKWVGLGRQTVQSLGDVQIYIAPIVAISGALYGLHLQRAGGLWLAESSSRRLSAVWARQFVLALIHPILGYALASAAMIVVSFRANGALSVPVLLMLANIVSLSLFVAFGLLLGGFFSHPLTPLLAGLLVVAFTRQVVQSSNRDVGLIFIGNQLRLDYFARTTLFGTLFIAMGLAFMILIIVSLAREKVLTYLALALAVGMTLSLLSISNRSVTTVSSARDEVCTSADGFDLCTTREYEYRLDDLVVIANSVSRTLGGVIEPGTEFRDVDLGAAAPVADATSEPPMTSVLPFARTSANSNSAARFDARLTTVGMIVTALGGSACKFSETSTDKSAEGFATVDLTPSGEVLSWALGKLEVSTVQPTFRNPLPVSAKSSGLADQLRAMSDEQISEFLTANGERLRLCQFASAA